MLRKRNHELEEQVAAGKRRRLQDSKLDKASIEASVQSVHFMESAKEAALRSIDLQQAKLLDDIEDVAVPDVVESVEKAAGVVSSTDAQDSKAAQSASNGGGILGLFAAAGGIGEKSNYEKLYAMADSSGRGFIESASGAQLLSRSGLPPTVLGNIWSIIEVQGDVVSKDQFFAALRLVAHAQSGQSPTQALVSVEPRQLPDFEVVQQDQTGAEGSWFGFGDLCAFGRLW